MITGLDHVAVPLKSVDEMLTFYRSLGFTVKEEYFGLLYSVYVGDNKLNFHVPQLWQDENMTLRGRQAVPGSGDFCFVWEGTEAGLLSLLDGLGAGIEEGPVERTGGRSQGAIGMSVYTRDPDQNLLEFIIYS
jgi:catechol 2,3-dioxygenase-like lactoylglutathione lyase family enzyme